MEWRIEVVCFDLVIFLHHVVVFLVYVVVVCLLCLPFFIVCQAFLSLSTITPVVLCFT